MAYPPYLSSNSTEPQAFNTLIIHPEWGYPIDREPINLDFVARLVFPLYNSQGEILGSSHFITPELLVTVAHVIDSVDKFFVSVSNQNYEISNFPMRIFKDICLIDCTSLKFNFQYLKLGESTGGESVYLFHAANGRISKEKGIVSFTSHGASLNLEFQSKGEPGACGGAIVNINGELLGIHNGRIHGWKELRTGNNYLGINGVIENEEFFFEGHSWVLEAMTHRQIRSRQGRVLYKPDFHGVSPEGKGKIKKLFMEATTSIKLLRQDPTIQKLLDKASVEYSGYPSKGLDQSDFEACFEEIMNEKSENLVALLGCSRVYETTRVDCQNEKSRKKGASFNVQPQIGGKHGKGKSTIIPGQSSFGLLLIDEKCLGLDKSCLGEVIRYSLLLSIFVTRYPDEIPQKEIPVEFVGDLRKGGVAKITILA